MTIAAIISLLFGLACIGLVGADVPRWRKNYDVLDYCISVGVAAGGLCTVAVALRTIF